MIVNKQWFAVTSLPLLVVVALQCSARVCAGSGNTFPVNPHRLDGLEGVVAMAINPDPAVYPTMSLKLHTREIAFVVITFPDVPGSRVNACVFESTHPELRFDLIDLSLPGDNKITLRHRLSDMPYLHVITTFTAEPGAVECDAKLRLDPEWAGKEIDPPDHLRWPNICWSSSLAPNFAPGGQAKSWKWTKRQYYDWIGRCFIFTEGGQTFLDKTRRRTTPEVPEDDVRNSPPLFAWSQHYAGVWEDPVNHPPTPNTSLDGYEIPLIGAVSSDGKSLIALAGDWTEYIAQAWGACFHHIPQWMPADAPLLERSFRMKLYGMRNDPDELLKRAKLDFPDAAKRAIK